MADRANVIWNNDSVKLHSPTAIQYKEVLERLSSDPSVEWSLNVYSASIAANLVQINRVSTLISLGLFKCSLDVYRISGSLANNKTLRVVWFDNCSIGYGLLQLCNEWLMATDTLQTLWITNDATLNDKTVRCIGQVLSINKSIKQLSLQGCDISDQGISVLMKCLSLNKSLCSISLAANRRITSSSANDICQMMKSNTTLNELHLFDTSLTDGAVHSICQVLQWTTSANRIISLSQLHRPFCKELKSFDKIKDKLRFT